MSLNSLKWAAILCFVVAMAVFLGGGIVMKKDLPPYPGKVVGPDGKVLFEKANIIAGQNVYQRYGLMDQGAVWGHGSQRGPEFSAASLKLMADAIGDYYARKDYGKSYKDLEGLQKGLVDVKITHETKPNRYDAATDTLKLTAAQVEGLNRIKLHWGKVFTEGLQRYGFLPNTIKEEKQRLEISRFFFWTAWVASTLRPGTDYSYTNNWPPDKRVGNVASTETYFYSIAGILALLLFSWRGLVDKAYWKDGILRLSFWGLNGGLFLMAFVTLLPVGAMQAWISFKDGLWAARSADFFESAPVVWLGTFRALPDTIIIVLGVLPLAYFLITTYPHLKAAEIEDGESVWERLGIEL